MIDTRDGNEPVGGGLDEMLCFNLYAAARAMNRAYCTFLAPWDLTYPQYLVLKLLWSRKAMNVGDIAKSLMLDSGTTTPLVRRMEARGLLHRTRSATDERVVSVTLTPKGQAMEKEMTDLASILGAATGLDRTEAQLAISALQSINKNLARDHTSALTPSAQKSSRQEENRPRPT